MGFEDRPCIRRLFSGLSAHIHEHGAGWLRRTPLDSQQYSHFIIALAPALMAYRTITPAAKNGIMGSAADEISDAATLPRSPDSPILPGYFFGQKPGILTDSEKGLSGLTEVIDEC